MSVVPCVLVVACFNKACPHFFVRHLLRDVHFAGSPRGVLPSVGDGDDRVLLGGMSSSRSRRPLPRFRTTQLHGDRRWQGPGRWFEVTTRRRSGSTHALGGSRPDRLPNVSGPQGRVPRRIVEQIVDSAPVVPLLHAPEPQLVDSAGEVLKILDKLVPDVEQVIDVPMIFPEDYRIRTFRSSPGAADGRTVGGSARDRARQGGAWLRHMGPRLRAYFGVRVLRARARHWVERHRQPRAVYKYWAQVRSLRPCQTSSSSLMVPLCSSSTELDIAVMLQRQVRTVSNCAFLD